MSKKYPTPKKKSHYQMWGKLFEELSRIQTLCNKHLEASMIPHGSTKEYVQASFYFLGAVRSLFFNIKDFLAPKTMKQLDNDIKTAWKESQVFNEYNIRVGGSYYTRAKTLPKKIMWLYHEEIPRIYGEVLKQMKELNILLVTSEPYTNDWDPESDKISEETSLSNEERE